MMTVDQFGHQRADALQHAQHRGTDAQFGSALRGLGLVGAVDAEQFGAFARDADDVLAVIGRGDEVSIGDAATQWTDLNCLAGEQVALAHEPLHVCPLVHTSTV